MKSLVRLNGVSGTMGLAALGVGIVWAGVLAKPAVYIATHPVFFRSPPRGEDLGMHQAGLTSALVSSLYSAVVAVLLALTAWRILHSLGRTGPARFRGASSGAYFLLAIPVLAFSTSFLVKSVTGSLLAKSAPQFRETIFSGPFHDVGPIVLATLGAAVLWAGARIWGMRVELRAARAELNEML